MNIILIGRIRPFKNKIQFFDNNHYFKSYIYMNVIKWMYVFVVISVFLISLALIKWYDFLITAVWTHLRIISDVYVILWLNHDDIRYLFHNIFVTLLLAPWSFIIISNKLSHKGKIWSRIVFLEAHLCLIHTIITYM